MRPFGDRIRRRAMARSFAFTATVALLVAAGARADQPTGSSVEALREANAGLAAERENALLELYALESRLDATAARVTSLRADAERVEARRADAERRLRLVRGTLTEAETRLEERLRALYIEGDADPLAVLLGAQTLEEAIDALDGFQRLAGEDRRILTQVEAARASVTQAVGALAEREAELADLITSAEAAQTALVAAKAERAAYLDRLAREQRLNEAAIAELASQSQAASDANAELTSADSSADSSAGSSGGSGGSSGGGGGGSAPPPVIPSGPPGARQMTVVATGYSLPGTTATGIPVGWGVVAVDPSVIPLGTKMTIPGYGEGIAADTGSAVRGAIIDLWFPTTQQALTWGRRTVTITIHS